MTQYCDTVEGASVLHMSHNHLLGHLCAILALANDQLMDSNYNATGLSAFQHYGIMGGDVND